jgi:hypothetical protein
MNNYNTLYFMLLITGNSEFSKMRMTFSTSRALAPHDKKLFPEKRSPIKNTFS